jgi:DNA-binding transcriptional MerR regulator
VRKPRGARADARSHDRAADPAPFEGHAPAWARDGGLIPIGRFSRITGIPISALRFYDEHGVFRPAMVDPQSGYRYFSLEQLDLAVILHMLRDLEVPLPEVKELLAADPDEIYRALEMHRRRMLGRQRGIDGIIARLDRLLDGDRPMLNPVFQVVEASPLLVISRRATCTRPHLDETIVSFSEQLRTSLRRRSEPRSAREVVLYHDLLRRHEAFDIEVCVPVVAGGAGAWELPGGEAARTVHYGTWSEIWGTHAALLSWIVRERRRPRGPLREVYVVDDRDVHDSRDYVTELTWLID